MKREALNHPKMLDLAARLDISLAQAIGHVTLLVNWTADFAIQGDIGKWPDGAIARGAGWPTEPTTFVTALVDAGWLDRSETYRLLLHDWPDHAERWVRAKLHSLGLAFCPEYHTVPTGPTIVETTGPTTVATPPRDRTKPNQTEPNQTEPNREMVARAKAKTGEKHESTWVDAINGTPYESESTRQAFRDWSQHYEAMTGKRLTFVNVQAMLRHAAHNRWPPAKLLAAIDLAIRKSWKSLVDPDEAEGRANGNGAAKILTPPKSKRSAQ